MDNWKVDIYLANLPKKKEQPSNDSTSKKLAIIDFIFFYHKE
jgi:hypothetical protein